MPKVLLLGASGYLGARLFYDLDNNFELVGTYGSNQLVERFVHLDIRNEVEIEQLITQLQPAIIVHAANNPNGGWAETHPEEAKLLNQTATQFIVNAANKNNAKLVYISSFAAANPIDVYSKTKAASEEIVKQTQAGWTIIRPSWIAGLSPNQISNSAFNRLLKTIGRPESVVVDSSWHLRPTYIGHLSAVLKGIVEQNIWGEMIPVVINDVVSRYELARDILTPFGIKVDPEDKGVNIPLVPVVPTFFEQFHIPQMNYQQMVQTIIDEIKHREKFTL